MAVDELAELMTHRGVKVEAVLRPWEGLEGVVVARVLEVRDHPNSDKLCLARLQHAAGEIELVVGVRNMAPGDLVPWAPPGARVPTLEEPLGEREIRGVVSHGMLCSPRELAISGDHGGILVLERRGLGRRDRPQARPRARSARARHRGGAEPPRLPVDRRGRAGGGGGNRRAAAADRSRRSRRPPRKPRRSRRCGSRPPTDARATSRA